MDSRYFAILAVFCVCSTQALKIDRSARNYQRIPDRLKNTADFVQKWGYPAEEHVVATQDGYELTLFRVPTGVNNSTEGKCRVPVLMQHGIFLNSDQWILRGTHDLPFLLAEMGFDVWMSNTRGTRYSRHLRYSINDYRFWNYSPDEISANDLPAVIDYVLDTTKAASLSYVGHSRGCAMAVMLLSDRPEYNKKVHLLQLLAPVIYSTHAPNPLYYLAGKRPFTLMSTSQFQEIRQGSHMGRMLSLPPILKMAAQTLCSTGTALDMICPLFYFFINGEGFKNFNYSLTPMLLDHFTEGMGTKEVIHLQQISESNRFQKYDYNKEGNLKMYGAEIPPEYDISRVKVPTFIYYGSNDLFISEKDLGKFARQLPNLRGLYRVPYVRFNHIDYLWGLNTNKVLFPRFLADIANSHKKCRISIGPN